MKNAEVASTQSPFGPVWVALGSRGIVSAGFYDTRDALAEAMARRGFRVGKGRSTALAGVLRELTRRLSGKPRQKEVPLDLDGLPSFYRAVWSQLLRIPRGEVRTYGEVAQAVGRARAARAVGRACAENPIPIFIPCHRVTSAGGGIGGYGPGIEVKRWLLRLEGVKLETAIGPSSTKRPSRR